MLALDDPARPLDRSLLDAPGGFAWWYADARDAKGDGFVGIWSWGLPFLPGDRSARRRGRPRPASARPSVNLVAYRDARPAFYTLYELDPADARWEDDARVFGDNRIAWSRQGGQVHFEATVDLPVPAGGRLTGVIEVRGPALRRAPGEADGARDHAWTPLMGPARATGTLAHDGRPVLAYDGPGYHDRNGSTTPLDALGIAHWTWGRAVFGDELVVHYLTWPEDVDAAPHLVVVRVDAAGQVRVHTPVGARLVGRRRTMFGMPWWRRVEVDVDGEPLVVEHAAPVDVGPFYLRAGTTTHWRGQVAPGWAELCRPDRIDLDVHRFLVNMAVQRAAGPNSMWMPLFVGTQHDRMRRLLRSWRGRAA